MKLVLGKLILGINQANEIIKTLLGLVQPE